jgi:hypothetical protein
MWGDGSKLFNSNEDQVSFEGDDENSNTWDYSSSCCLKYEHVLPEGALSFENTNSKHSLNSEEERRDGLVLVQMTDDRANIRAT